jgi:hypothetical protein
MVEQASPQDGGRPRVSYASGLWHDSTRTLKPAYRDVAAAFLRSVVRAVDFLTKVSVSPVVYSYRRAWLLLVDWIDLCTN